MIKLFVFDLGNVILPFDHRPIGNQLWERSEKRETLSADAIFGALFDREAGLVNAYERGLVTSREFFAQLQGQFALSLGFEEFKGIWNPIFRENRRVAEAITRLQDRGYPLFLLSDTNELHFTHIRERYPIVGAFDRWILSFEAGAKKPEKAIFDAIFTGTTVAPDEVFYIDDIARYVEAARGYGIPGMVFRDEASLWQTLDEMGVWGSGPRP